MRTVSAVVGLSVSVEVGVGMVVASAGSEGRESLVRLRGWVGVFWVMVRVPEALAVPEGGCGVEGSESESSSQATSSSGPEVAPK